MALHTETSIYKDAYKLLSVAADSLVQMPRNVKAMFGVRLRDLLLEILSLIGDANIARDKVPHLTALLRRLRETELLLRLCQEKKYIPTGHYAAAVYLTQSVGKQANGWRRKYASSPAT